MDDVGLGCINVEIRQTPLGRLKTSEIKEIVENYLKVQENVVFDKELHDSVLPPCIKSIRICPNSDKVKKFSDNITKHYHVYQVWEEEPQADSLYDDNDEVIASLNWCLPNAAFEGLWESLILENGLKEQLMSYVQTILLYSNKKVNAQIVHWNGIVLLHGPPGTGKTSLCKALAQKLSIRLSSRYKTSQLIEINTHGLFSKWFSESAKLVSKMFATVKQWLESDDHFVCILIDEVESLTHVRQSNGTEPSDSIRVVNAVLTQIDQLQRYPNFLILATSNVTDTIDIAFADRADLKLFIPYPSKFGVYEILRSCIEELVHTGLIKGKLNNFFDAVMIMHDSLDNGPIGNDNDFEILQNSRLLLDVSAESCGLSGRALRKIPFLTSTRFIGRDSPDVTEFIKIMQTVVHKHKTDSKMFFNGNASIC